MVFAHVSYQIIDACSIPFSNSRVYFKYVPSQFFGTRVHARSLTRSRWPSQNNGIRELSKRISPIGRNLDILFFLVFCWCLFLRFIVVNDPAVVFIVRINSSLFPLSFIHGPNYTRPFDSLCSFFALSLSPLATVRRRESNDLKCQSPKPVTQVRRAFFIAEHFCSKFWAPLFCPELIWRNISLRISRYYFLDSRMRTLMFFGYRVKVCSLVRLGRAWPDIAIQIRRYVIIPFLKKLSDSWLCVMYCPRLNPW